jgi:hypothetical protein
MHETIPAATDNTPGTRPTLDRHVYIPDASGLSCSFCGLPTANHRHGLPPRISESERRFNERVLHLIRRVVCVDDRPRDLTRDFLLLILATEESDEAIVDCIVSMFVGEPF